MKVSGKTLSEIRSEFEKNRESLPFPIIKMGFTMERGLLRKRVRQRVVEMLKRGLLDETRELVNQGYGNWSPLKSVGYKECQEFLKQGGKGGDDKLLENIVTSTMQLAKRQMTWFRKDSKVSWYERGEVEDWKEPLEWLERTMSFCES